MTNDDERREVAARLRDSIPADLHLGKGNKAWGLLYLTLFGRYMPNQASGRTYKQVAELLADLIEPEPERTARLEYDEFHGCNICTGCGERYKHGRYMAETYDGLIVYKPMRCCPACGARLEGVVR